jgi:hypothetical protein
MTDEHEEQPLQNVQPHPNCPEPPLIIEPQGTTHKSINDPETNQRPTAPKTMEDKTNKAIMRATWVIAVATCLYVVVAGFQLCTMSGQLGQMIESSWQTDNLIVAANKQHNAMNKIADATKQVDETSRLRDRAFVYFAPNFRLYPDPKNPVVWAIEIFFENFGAMPARKILIKYKCIILDKEVSDPFNLGEWKRAEVGTVIGPKQPGGFLAHQGDFKEVGLIKQGKLIVYVVARIEYKDGFDFKTIRVTEISRKLNVDPYNGHTFYLAGPHNCSDEDCH